MAPLSDTNGHCNTMSCRNEKDLWQVTWWPVNCFRWFGQCHVMHKVAPGWSYRSRESQDVLWLDMSWAWFGNSEHISKFWRLIDPLKMHLLLAYKAISCGEWMLALIRKLETFHKLQIQDWDNGFTNCPLSASLPSFNPPIGDFYHNLASK